MADSLQTRSPIHLIDRLTPRERDVLQLLCQDLRPAQIAAELHVAEKTVRMHIDHLNSKFGTRSYCATAMLASALGILNMEST